LPALLGLPSTGTPRHAPQPAERTDWRIRIAGFGGQGVLLLGQLLAEAGMDGGLHVSWLPSYGPEMRSGTSNCHVRICSEPVDSPVVSKPNALLALNEPSLRKFIADVERGGVVLYNGAEVPPDCRRHDIRVVAEPFAEIADNLGSAKALNVVMLGAFLSLSRALPDTAVDSALRRLVKSERWLALDRRALAVGRERVPAEELTYA
jgi:Pyruvate/2-oxoacid:ferredoxin oxidoreductase gamma subunit